MLNTTDLAFVLGVFLLALLGGVIMALGAKREYTFKVRDNHD
jgi:hypothetical protein